MREHKFRGYAKEIKLLCDVSFVDFELKIVRLDVGKLKDTEWCYQDEYNFDDIELLEYTGLKDKRGVEIFVGDIVRQKYPHQDKAGDVIQHKTIRFLDELGCFGAVYKDDFNWTGMEEHKEFTIIGNIYQNGDLL